MLFAAVHEFARGAKRTSGIVLLMSVFGDEADIRRQCEISIFWPKADIRPRIFSPYPCVFVRQKC